MRGIAKAQRPIVAEINEVIDCWAASAIVEEIRENTLALVLALRTHCRWRRAVRCPGHQDYRARCVMLSTPQTAVLQIVDEVRPRETSTDRIERVLNALIEDQKETIRPPIDCRRERSATTSAAPLG
jgi:transposase